MNPFLDILSRSVITFSSQQLARIYCKRCPMLANMNMCSIVIEVRMHGHFYLSFPVTYLLDKKRDNMAVPFKIEP